MSADRSSASGEQLLVITVLVQGEEETVSSEGINGHVCHLVEDRTTIIHCLVGLPLGEELVETEMMDR